MNFFKKSGDEAVVKDGAAVTVSKEARDEYVKIMTARDEARYQLMIATGDLWYAEDGERVIAVELDGGFLDAGLWQVRFLNGPRADTYGWVSMDDLMPTEQ